MANFTESIVEDAALAWLDSFGDAIKQGPEIAPGELFTERAVNVTNNATVQLRGKFGARQPFPNRK